MRKVGLWFIGLGLAGQLLISTFYAVSNLFELYTNDWYSTASKLIGVGNVLSDFLLLLGFIMFAASLQHAAPGLRPGYQAGNPTPQGVWSQPVVPNVPVRPSTAEDRLARLRSLHEEGHLTSEELVEQRAKVLEAL